MKAAKSGRNIAKILSGNLDPQMQKTIKNIGFQQNVYHLEVPSNVFQPGLQKQNKEVLEKGGHLKFNVVDKGTQEVFTTGECAQDVPVAPVEPATTEREAEGPLPGPPPGRLRTVGVFGKFHVVKRVSFVHVSGFALKNRRFY